MKMNIKKVATIVGSALMIGATAGMAAAAAYPAPFVSNGAANVAIVVGGNAALSDGLAASAIAADLATDLAAQTATGATTTGSSAEGGDSYKIEKSSNKFNYGNSILDVDSSSLDKKDLPTLLADGTYLDSSNDEFEYKQTIDLANLSLGLFDEDEYMRDTPTVGFDVSEGTYVLAYTLDMTDTVNWSKLQTTELPILGKMYYVLSTSGSNTITLLDSAVSAEVNEGETTTLKVGEKSYEVSARITDADSVKLTINGETTNTLDETQTQRLSDGAYVGIKDIAYSSKESGVSSVEFSIGSGKLKLVNGSDVELNDDAIDNLAVTITNDGSAKLDKIVLNWSAQEDSWITPTSEIEMPGFKAIKLAFGGMNYPKSEQIIVKADGDDNIVLSNFPLADGVTETINLVYSNGTYYTLAGKDSNNKLAVSTVGNGTLTFTKNVDDYFAVTYVSGEDAASYLVRATNWDDADYPDNTVDFEYLSSSGWKSLDTGVTATDDITVGDASFTVNSVSNESSSATVTVTVGSNTAFNKLVSAEGLQVDLPFYNTTAYNQSSGLNCSAIELAGNQISQFVIANVTTANTTCYADTYILNFTEENKDDAIGLGKSFQVTVGLDTDSEVYVTGVAGDSTAYEMGETDVYVSYIVSDLNTKIEDDQSGDHEKVTLTYHGAESFGDVFVLAPSAAITAGSGSTTGATQLGAITIKDSEVSSVSGKNLIVIGGSCVNSVAADLLGGAACDAAFTAKAGVKAGEALIKSFARGDKVALLVAGFNAEDTTKAATYLTMKGADTTVGAALKVTSATEATAITA